MTKVKSRKILPKLHKVGSFILGEERIMNHPIEITNHSPYTDGVKVYLPEEENHFKKIEDNEFSLAHSSAHEYDHIQEFIKYFGEEYDLLLSEGKNPVEEYCFKNYSELTENLGLACWIDNVVKDRRIDFLRGQKFSGVKNFQDGIFNATSLYLRPSIKGMSEIDALREQYLQKALIGKTVEPVIEGKEKLLEEIVELTCMADNIEKDKDIVRQIYEKFKENFDIKKPISNLPSKFGSNSHTNFTEGNGNSRQNSHQDKSGRIDEDKSGAEKDDDEKYSKDKNKEDFNERVKSSFDRSVNQREGRDENDLRPECMVENEKDENVSEKVMRNPLKKMERKPYDSFKSITEFYNPEIDSMKRILRKVQMRKHGETTDFEGEELDYETYMQTDLESKITGIGETGKHFRNKKYVKQKPVFGVHADISGSTQGEIIIGIKGALYVIGNAFASTNYHYGIYASDDNFFKLKSPDEKWRDSMSNKIVSLKHGFGGIYLARTNNLISPELEASNGEPKGLFIISDFEVCGDFNSEKESLEKLREKGITPYLIVIGKEHEQNARNLLEGQRRIERLYGTIDVKEIYNLPREIFRLFKSSGVIR